MIGTKKTTAGYSAPNTDAVNRIVEGTEFEGSIKSESNLRIDGSFSGDLVTKGRLVVGAKGLVSGNVRCAHCEVEGTLEGEIEVLELLALKSSAKVTGSVHYGQLSVEAGAQPVGTFRMGKKEVKEAPLMGKPGAVNTLVGAEVETGIPTAPKQTSAVSQSAAGR